MSGSKLVAATRTRLATRDRDGYGAGRLGKQLGVDDSQQSSLVRGDLNIRHLQALTPVILVTEQTSPTDMSRS